MATLYVEDGYVSEKYAQTGISVDWANKVIHVPRMAMVLIQTTPIIVYNLDLNIFRLELKTLEGEETGMIFPDTHSHVAPVTVSGIQLARILEIINDYTVTFEDGQYAVNLVGANSNVGDRVNVNQVSVRVANSAGLVTSEVIEYGEYGRTITVDSTSPYSGTITPIGTYRRPVNNLDDALTMARDFGFPRIRIIGDLTITAGQDVSGLKLISSSHVNSSLTIEDGAICNGAAFEGFDITGVLDPNVDVCDCILRDVSITNGNIGKCYLHGTITLNGTQQLNMQNCAVLNVLNPPTLDMGNSNQNLMMPDFSGKVIITNLDGTDLVGIGLDAGEVEIDASCVGGVITISGSGNVVDNSNGTYVVDYITQTEVVVDNDAIAGAVWADTTRTLTSGDNITAETDNAAIAEAVWSYTRNS